MKIYVGRWDLLPEDWDGVNGLDEKVETEITHEVAREASEDEDDNFIGVYDPEEFEAEFDHTLTEHISSQHYWIKIFAES